MEGGGGRERESERVPKWVLHQRCLQGLGGEFPYRMYVQLTKMPGALPSPVTGADGPTLYRSYVGDHSCCEFKNATAMPRPELSIPYYNKRILSDE